MATKCSVPDGYHSITPYFTVRDAARLIEFLVAAFNATIIVDKRYSSGTVQHARVRIGDSIIMMNESTGEYPVNLSQIHLYVEDTDTTFSNALVSSTVRGNLAASMVSLTPTGDGQIGERRDRFFKAPFGSTGIDENWLADST